MAVVGPTFTVNNGFAAQLRDLTLPPARPVLVTRDAKHSESSVNRRTKIWEFNTNLHCSVIGTCLSTTELRQTLKRLGLAPDGSTDHELHGTAVSLAGRHDQASKVLHKALDARHCISINQFGKARSEDELRSLWQAAVQRGEIPGAYWAVLTHPSTPAALIRLAFSEVHMLSHLVGSANRADIQRLCWLENEKAELQARIERQQVAFREAVVSRDSGMRELRQALAQRISEDQQQRAPATSGDAPVLRQVVADLESRLASETRRRVAMEKRFATTASTLNLERAGRQQAERDRDGLQAELAALEEILRAASGDATTVSAPIVRLDGAVLLYVGGRPNQVVHLRTISERSGATLLHHDGGIKDHISTLPGLASRADVVLFPVDCVSHEAMLAVKALCRQSAKRFLPLRSASVASLVAALRRPELTRPGGRCGLIRPRP